DSYGSHEFVDHHFHYGYFTRSAGLLAFEDPDFAADFGPMATLVAKQYANWDRADLNFPFMRTFDLWGGHSYAGGFSSPGGNNQESSSEAIQSWAGLFMLGSALNNDAMRDAGAMGYVMERAAVREYWLDVHGDILPEAYGHSSTGILFDSGQAYATYFSGDPAWMYGIQWLPAATHLGYLGWDRAFSTDLMADMIEDRPITLLGGIAGGSRYALWEARQSWYGIADNALNREAAIADITNAIRNAYLHNPGYVGALNTSNPFYDPVAGSLYFTVNGDGTLAFPASHWTPATLPASLVPPDANPATPFEEPVTWNVWQYLGVNYVPDAQSMLDIYSYDVRGYDSSETQQAADVYDLMGDGLGNVVLGFAAQYDPDFYADVHAELWDRDSAVAKGRSMAGVVYYQAYSQRGLGVPVTSRHTGVPTSQVYQDPDTNAYSYVVYNPSTTQQTVTVYDSATGASVGSFPVPARTLVNHGLDQTLDQLVISASNPATTIQPGQTVQFGVTGFDQYGATFPLGAVSWSVAGGGGTINASGLFTATTNADPVTVTVSSGGETRDYEFRVGPAPVLTNLSVTPGFTRVVAGMPVTFAAGGLDQYGDPTAPGAVTWSTTVPGASIDSAGVFTDDGVGTGHVTASAGGRTGTAVVAVQADPGNLALGGDTTYSTSSVVHTAANAVDGDPATRWESDFADNQWLAVDLGARHELTRVFIDWEPAYAATYEVQVADSPSGPWTTLVEVAKNSPADDDLAVSGAGRYVRINCLTRGTGYGFSIFELEVYGWLGGDAVTTDVVRLNPAGATVVNGQTLAYQAYAFDTAGRGGPVAATSWSVTGGGTIDGAGVFTATTEGGPFTVTGAFGGVDGSTAVTVIEGGSAEEPELINVALGKTATSSSYEGGFVAANAFDGSAGTRWASDAADGESIEVDLGEVVNIHRFDLSWETAYGSAYRIQVRNTTGDAWTTVVTETAGDGGEDSHAYAVSARYVRLVGDARGTPWGYSLWEFEVYAEAPSGMDLALGKTAFATSVEGAFVATNVTDGNPATRWASDAEDDESIYVDLGSAKTLSSVTLVWETAYGSSYVLEGTNDTGGSWTSLAVETAGDGGTDFHAVSGSYRYVRMRGVDRGTPWGYSLWSFEVR
ncbi:MAG: discoidin domain-containing protein, partial [Verrucomicrobiota bacterium]